MNFTTKDLQTILYSLEGYMQGNDDNELVEELDDICYRINKKLEELWYLLTSIVTLEVERMVSNLNVLSVNQFVQFIILVGQD